MKIVINKCYGGFGLSDAVHKRLLELGIKHFNSLDEIPNDWKEPYVADYNKYGEAYASNFRDNEFRNHPLLIQAIEEVGESKASGSLAKVRIIEIPDDVEWELDDYDGIESIHENHRSW